MKVVVLKITWQDFTEACWALGVVFGPPQTHTVEGTVVVEVEDTFKRGIAQGIAKTLQFQLEKKLQHESSPSGGRSRNRLVRRFEIHS